MIFYNGFILIIIYWLLSLGPLRIMTFIIFNYLLNAFWKIIRILIWNLNWWWFSMLTSSELGHLSIYMLNTWQYSRFLRLHFPNNHSNFPIRILLVILVILLFYFNYSTIWSVIIIIHNGKLWRFHNNATTKWISAIYWIESLLFLKGFI